MPHASLPDLDVLDEITCPGDGPTFALIAGLGEQIGSVEHPAESDRPVD